MTSSSPSLQPRQIQERIATQIRAQGVVTVADFMRLALTARELGYYTSRDPLGTVGDFITAPEISQMFGEMIGIWLMDTWQRLGSPSRINIVELGPGRGTLMADALRAAKLAPDFLSAVDLHLVEISKPLRDLQSQQLRDHQPGWHDSFDTVPAGPLLIIANEFFDALPIHQFLMTEKGWRERGITLRDGDERSFTWTLMPPGPQLALIPDDLRRAAIGSIMEISPGSQQVMGLIAKRCAQYRGAALIIDYGPSASGHGDTFQALRQHRYHDPLMDVGDADLTAHVDFAQLCKVAEQVGCTRFGPIDQGDFLRALGIEMRAEILARDQDQTIKDDIDLALHRLIDAAQMGTLFKVIAVASSPILELAGFA